MPKSVLQNEESAKFVQLLLLQVETSERARFAAEQSSLDAATSRDEWKGLYFEQKTRADKLENADAQRIKESTGLNIALQTIRDQLKDADQDRENLNRELSKARSGNKLYAGIGFAGGAATCGLLRR